MNSRLILIAFSVLGAGAAFAAAVEGIWQYAAILYALTIIGLLLLLRSAVGTAAIRTNELQRDKAVTVIKNEHEPPDLILPKRSDTNDPGALAETKDSLTDPDARVGPHENRGRRLNRLRNLLRNRRWWG